LYHTGPTHGKEKRKIERLNMSTERLEDQHPDGLSRTQYEITKTYRGTFNAECGMNASTQDIQQ
jgi:hypothetical protein